MDSDICEPKSNSRRKRRQFLQKQNLLGVKKVRKNVRWHRRKRNKLRIVAYVKQLEHDKRSKLVDSCVQTMETVTQNYVPYGLKEVEDFNNKHEITYWKSKAMSLELENKMLLEHIKKMHSLRIQDWVDSQNDAETVEYGLELTNEQNDYEESSHNTKKDNKKKYYPPPEPKSNTINVEKFDYGSKPKSIIGVETTAEMNSDNAVDEMKANFCPSVSFNL